MIICFNYARNKRVNKLPLASPSKWGLVHNYSYKNDINLHVNEISF